MHRSLVHAPPYVGHSIRAGRYTQLPAESNGQDSASAMVAGATAAAARGTAALLDFVSAQYLALDAKASARI